MLADRSVCVLLLGVSILSLGHGLHGSLVGVRARRKISTPRPPASSCRVISRACCSAPWSRRASSRGSATSACSPAFASVVSTAVLLIPLVGRSGLVVPHALRRRALHIRSLHRVRKLAQFRLEQQEPRPAAVDLHDRHLCRDGARAVSPQCRRRIGLFALHHRLGAAVLGAGAADAGADRDAKSCRHAQGQLAEIYRASPLAIVATLRQRSCAERLLQHGRRLRADAGPAAALRVADDGAAAAWRHRLAISGGPAVRSL